MGFFLVQLYSISLRNAFYQRLICIFHILIYNNNTEPSTNSNSNNNNVTSGFFLHGARGGFVNKKTQVGLNNLAIHF